MEYDAIVIGAGIGGLFSALKLSLAGKKVLLLERQPLPGGLATAFKRGGFTFESSLHCVDALGPGQDIREYLDEAGITKKIGLIELKEFCRIIYPEHDFLADFNPDNFKSYLKDKFPAEEKGIERLFRKLAKFYKQFDIYAYSGLPSWLKFIAAPFLYPSLITVSRLTFDELLSRYIKDDKLKAIISDIWRYVGLPPTRVSALYFLLVFRGYYCQPTSYVRGGFSQLFKVIVDTIREAGSEVKFNTTAKRIITDGHRRVHSVVTEKGEEFKARVIISNANPIISLTSLLDDEKLKAEYRSVLPSMERSISAFQVYLGLKVPASDLGMDCHMFSIDTTYSHEDNLRYCLTGDYENCSLALVDHAQVDTSLVPAGKGSLLIMTLDNYGNWDGLSQDEYKKRKIDIAGKLIQRAEKYLPGLSRNIEIMEVGTPRTIERFGMVPGGAIYGFAQTVKQSGAMRFSQKTKVKGLLLAGSWTFPGGGMHACFVSGMEAADMALKLLK